MRFQDENESFCNMNHDYRIGKIVRDAKIRRIEGNTRSTYDDCDDNYQFHVGGTTLCSDYARKALLEAAKITTERDQMTCKYSNNYPSPLKSSMSFPRFTSVCI